MPFYQNIPQRKQALTYLHDLGAHFVLCRRSRQPIRGFPWGSHKPGECQKVWGNQAAHASVAGVLPGPRFWGDIVDACELLVDYRVDNPLYDPGRGTRLLQRCRLAVCGSCGHISARIRHCPTLFGTPDQTRNTFITSSPKWSKITYPKARRQRQKCAYFMFRRKVAKRPRSTSCRVKTDPKTGASRASDLFQCSGGRLDAATLKPGYDRLRRFHALGQFRLREPGARLASIRARVSSNSAPSRSYASRYSGSWLHSSCRSATLLMS